MNYISRKNIGMLMSPQNVTLHPEDNYKKISKAFSNTSVQNLSVMKDGQLLGVVNQLDFLLKLNRENIILADKNITAKEVMSSNVLTLAEDTSIIDAIHALKNVKYKTIFIKSAKDEIIGRLDFENLVRHTLNYSYLPSGTPSSLMT